MPFEEYFNWNLEQCSVIKPTAWITMTRSFQFPHKSCYPCFILFIWYLACRFKKPVAGGFPSSRCSAGQRWGRKAPNWSAFACRWPEPTQTATFSYLIVWVESSSNFAWRFSSRRVSMTRCSCFGVQQSATGREHHDPWYAILTISTTAAMSGDVVFWWVSKLAMQWLLIEMGPVQIASSYPNFNGSHFGLPPSSIHRMTGLGGKFVWTVTYIHTGPICQSACQIDSLDQIEASHCILTNRGERIFSMASAREIKLNEDAVSLRGR